MPVTPPGVRSLSGNMDYLSFREACVIGVFSFLRDASYDTVESHAAFNYFTGDCFALKCYHDDTTFVDQKWPNRACCNRSEYNRECSGGLPAFTNYVELHPGLYYPCFNTAGGYLL